MKKIIFIAFLSASLLVQALRADTDEQVEARNVVLGVAGAWANDGFKVRDGHWFGALQPHGRELIAVNLYAGNQYWFSVGATDKAKKIAVTVYDETGLAVTTEPFSDGPKAAAGFSPTNSGQYFVGVALAEGEASSFCFVYSYK